MHPLQQQLDALRKYHEALGTKLASLERQLDPEHEDDIYDAVADKRADEVLQAPTMERQNYAVSSDSSVMYEGRRYSFKYMGSGYSNILINKVTPIAIVTEQGIFGLPHISKVREVKEPTKEWEIVEFRATGMWDGKGNSIFTRDSDGDFGVEKEYRFTEQSMLEGSFGSVKDGQFTIHAVRRLSDGTIWKVGDSVTNDTGGTGKIKRFEISEQGNLLILVDSFFFNRLISELKRPEPLFTTADGVSCYDGAVVYGCHATSGEHLKETITEFTALGLSSNFWYSTRAAAEAAYDKWLFEQPVLTLGDVVSDGFPLDYLETMKRIVKEKISKK